MSAPMSACPSPLGAVCTNPACPVHSPELARLKREWQTEALASIEQVVAEWEALPGYTADTRFRTRLRAILGGRWEDLEA